MNDSVWLLWFKQDRKEGEDTQLLIGVYRTEEAANSAIERLKDKAGFRDFPEGFRSYEAVLDRDGWTEGFTRL